MEFNLVEIVDWILIKAQENGWLVASVIANIAWAVFHNSSFTKFYDGAWNRITAQEKNRYYKNALDELKLAMSDERDSCNKQIKELRHTIEKQQEQIDLLREKEMALSIEIATLKERLDSAQKVAAKHLPTSRGRKKTNPNDN